MSLQQLFQLCITILFVAVLIQLFLALTLFHIRTFREERRARKSRKQDSHKKEEV